MTNNKQNSVEWLCERLALKLGTPLAITFYIDHAEEIEQAKAMHREEHGQTWDDSLDNLKARGMNEMRAYTDFDNYYAEKFGGHHE